MTFQSNGNTINFVVQSVSLYLFFFFLIYTLACLRLCTLHYFVNLLCHFLVLAEQKYHKEYEA